MTLLAQNRRARYDYEIEETFEAGIALLGTEVKSARARRISLQDSHALVEGDQITLYNMHIAPYAHGNRWNHEPKRPRRLLLNRNEINHLYGKARQKGYTLIPTRVYLKGPWIKVQLAVARGKKRFDKRRDIAARDAERRMRQAVRRRA
ncbi:MAG: SsrA-binding protein SmpB [Thermaerobacterales bacterium]